MDRENSEPKNRGAQVPDFSTEQRELLDELNELLSNPRASEILLSDWLHDGDLPRPSIALIVHIGWRLIHDPGIYREAAILDRNALADRIVELLRSESSETRINSLKRISVAIEADRLDFSEAHKDASPHVHEWILLIGDFLYPSDRWGDGKNSLSIAAGQRALARGIIEALFFRTIMHVDSERLTGLVQALQLVRDGRKINPPKRSQIAAGILRATPLLHEQLGMQPTKSEVKTFLLHAFPDDYTDHSNTWTEAFKIVGFPNGDDRKRIMDSEKIIGLAHDFAAFCAR